MVTPNSGADREKVVSKLPPALHQELKIRAAELLVDIQVAVAEGIELWRNAESARPTVQTAGSAVFSTWLPVGQWEQLKVTCNEREIPYVQGLAQAVAMWLEENPSARVRPAEAITRRIVVCNQKGGVGKTAVAAGIAQALAEGAESVEAVNRILRELGGSAGELVSHEQRVLLVDYDPQGHLTKQLGHLPIPNKNNSLALFMGQQVRDGHVRDLIVPISDERFGGRLDLLPSCQDAFLLDLLISRDRNRQATLERVLETVEQDYDVILIDCPPSLGLAMDAAIFYGRRRPGEKVGASGILVVVQAEDSSADAYDMLREQIEDGVDDWRIDIDQLGLVVNLYDGRRGYIATSSLQAWKDIGNPPVVGVIPDLKEQREAVRRKKPLFVHAPALDQAVALRKITKEIS
ncbi:ParA family protein [Streptomyces sp. NPDC004667]|uniref:ParA family protein n=1 Tax=Streptomyces sp. NPDC004667 TaxID=3154285 RepID=UPI0033BF8322